jgi:hypothetical protein
MWVVMAIISLTTVPPRFAALPEVLASLLSQSHVIEEIRVYIPKTYRRFPQWSGEVPQIPPQVRLIQVEEDFGPASKVLHAVKDLKGTSTPILFCDDDRIYPIGWAEGLLQAHKEKPSCCVAVHGRHLHEIIPIDPSPLSGRRAKVGKQYFDPVYRWQRTVQRLRQLRMTPVGEKPLRGLVPRAGYTEILLGYAGALVLPDFFDSAVFDIPDDVWMVDDIWLSGHLARRRIPIWLHKRQSVCLRAKNDPVVALRNSVFDGTDRDGSNKRAIAYFQNTYGIWRG